MKRIRYIRPTNRRSEANQRAATDHLEPFAITIVEGDQGRKFKNALKILKVGNHLVVQDFHTFARRRDAICDKIKSVFAKGALIEDATGTIHDPACEPSLIAGIMTGGTLHREKRERVAHNRADDAVRAKAEEMWRGEEFRRMTNGEIADAVGVSIVSLVRWFGPRGRSAGRPRR